MASYNHIAGQGLERLSALSDGLFSIAMTLIVLEIRIPDHHAIHTEQDLWNALMSLSPRIITYLLSFLTLGIFWVGQQTQFNYLERSDRNYTWMQFGFLAVIATMPFSTSLLADFITFRLALVLYWLNILVLGTILLYAWRYASRSALVKEDAPADISHLIQKRILVAQALYAIGALLCVFSTYWSIGFIVLVQLNYAFAPKIPVLSRL